MEQIEKDDKTEQAEQNDQPLLITKGGDGDGKERTMAFPDTTAVFKSNMDASRTNRDILDLFPMPRTALNIIKSIVLNGDLSIGLNLNFPSTTTTKITNLLEEILFDKYELNKQLESILDEMLFEKGSVPYLTLPKVLLDSTIKEALINVDESDETVDISDFINPDKKNEIFQPIPPSKSKPKLGITIFSDLSLITANEQMEDTMINNLNPYSDTISVAEAELEELDIIFQPIQNPKVESESEFQIVDPFLTDGDGLHIKLVTEYLIPVHLEVDKNKPIGYFFMTNANGKILTNSEDWLNMGAEYNSEEASTKELRKIIDEQKAKLRNLTTSTSPELELSDMMIYDKLVNDHIKHQLKNSKLRGVGAVSNTSSVSNIMFHRALEAKQTNLVYIPAEYITYYTFKKRNNGVGKSLLEDVAPLISMLAMLTFAKLRSDIENAVPKKLINIKIDETTKDVESTMAMFIEKYQKSFNKMFQWGNLSITETSSWVQALNTTYRFEHPDIPYNDISETIQDNNRRGVIESEDIDNLKKEILRSFGINAQMLDSTADVEFASVSILANDLSRLEMSKYQESLTTKNTEHAQKILRIDGQFKTSIEKIIDEDYHQIMKSIDKPLIELIKSKSGNNEAIIKKWLIKVIVNGIVLSLPTLRDEDEAKLKTQFEAYTDSLDTVMEYVLISDEGMSIFGDASSEIIRIYQEAIKTSLIRKWMLEHNYMVEVIEAVKHTNTGLDIPQLKDYMMEIEELVKRLNVVAPSIKKSVGKATKNLNKFNDKVTDGEGGDAGEPTPAQPVPEKPVPAKGDTPKTPDAKDGKTGGDGLDGLDDGGLLD